MMFKNHNLRPQRAAAHTSGKAQRQFTATVLALPGGHFSVQNVYGQIVVFWYVVRIAFSPPCNNLHFTLFGKYQT